MSNNVNNISNTENLMDNLDLLLLDVAIEDTDNSVCTQNTIDMTADYIQNTSFNIPISEVSQQAFINGSSNGLLTILASKGLYFLAAAFIGISSYLAINNFNNSPNNNLIPIISNADSTEIRERDNTLLLETLAIKQAELFSDINSEINVDMHPMILKFENSKANHLSEGTNYNSKGSSLNSKPNYEKFDKEYANIIQAENKDDIEIVVEDYKLINYLYNINIKGRKTVDKDKNTPVNIAVYEGEPFNIKKTEGLNELTFISKTDQAQNTKEAYDKNQSFNLELTENINYYIPKESQTNLEEFFQNQDNQSLLNPFYISNVEVSNKNYLKFLNWVKTYNGYADYDILKYDSLEEYKNDKIKAFKYTFYSKNEEIIKQYGSNTIDVFPKTEIWINDADNTYYKSNAYYIAHPNASNQPVVGINYYQALAYLDWLQYIWQQRINEQGINYSIEFDLPTAYEWEIAANKVWKASKCNKQNNTKHDVNNSIICNLAIKKSKDKEYRKDNGIAIMEDIHLRPDIYIIPNNVDKTIRCTKKSGIYNLTGNVSEWIKADYKTNWNNFYNYKSKQKDEINDKVKELASYFNTKCNNPNGNLVMGANWKDDRITSPNSNYLSAMLAKAFVDPMEQHCTIGFRYVVRVKLKDEQKQLLKIKTLGRNMPEVDYSSMHRNIEEKEDWYMEDPENFAFIPMGSFKNSEGKIVSVQAFYAQYYETNNLSWLLFLNYLIDNNRLDELKECTPNDKEWALKMSKEYNLHLKDAKIFSEPFYKTSISKKVIKHSNIHKERWTTFASEPVVGISYQAVELYAEWLHKIYGSTNSFRIPTEAEWEYMAKGGLQDNKYPFYLNSAINTAGCPLYNYHFEGREEENQRKSGFMPVDFYPPNDFGLYNISGNAAEMVREKKYTKGGSYKSTEEYIEIFNKEDWDQKASPTVGFRLVITFLGKSKTVKQITPPGTVWLKTNIYVDMTEVRNIDYREFLQWTEKIHGKKSQEYKNMLPDTNVWESNTMNNAPYIDYYFRHSAYRDYPLVGVSYEQATEYCKWRSDRVNEYMYLQNNKEVKWAAYKTYPNAPKVCEYRLPSKEIYDEIINAGFTESTLNSAKKSKSQLYNYKNNIFGDSIMDAADITAPVKSYWPNILGIYNLKGNVLELTDKKGISRGGSYINTLEELNTDKEYVYTKPESYLGFRCICYVNTSAIKDINNKSQLSSCKPDWKLIEKDGFIGYIDSDNNTIVKAKYESIGEFGEDKCDWAKVSINGKYGFINNKGEEVVKPKYDSIGKLGESQKGLFQVTVDGLIGYINTNGKEVIKPSLDSVE